VRVLSCPDKLKGALSASAAAAAVSDGFRRAGVEADELPLADGGEGTAEAIRSSLGGEWRETRVHDPFEREVDARFLVLPDGRAVVESAEAVGLARLAPNELDPLRASSRGVGELVRAAADGGASEILVALGGSATVDGGKGMLEELDALPVRTIALCDVRNPLLGARGAARVFGPQKGAGPEEVEELERRLGSMRALTAVAELPGAGAAGGLGAAFAALGATLVPGIETVLDVVGFRERARGARLVVTGEGTVDASSAEGKTPAGVAIACRAEGVPCLVFGGRVEPGAAEALHALGATAVLGLGGIPEHARADLTALGEAVGRLVRELAPDG
jgi:glycerate kinase